MCVAARNARDESCLLSGREAWSRRLRLLRFEGSPPSPLLSLRLLSTVPRGITMSLCGCLSLMQVDGQTALHMAAAKGHTDVVKVVLASGANVSATAVRGLVSCVCGGVVWP